MKVRCYLSQNENENMVMESFFEGCSEEDKKIVPLTDYEPSDVAVVFGVYKKNIPVSFPRGRVIAKQQIRKLNTIILETGYINRGAGEDKYYAAGWNGLNGRADFRNKGSPSDRADQLPVKLKPWRESGDHVVLCGQVPWDASVDHTNHMKWLVETAAVLQMITKRPILFRPHPLASVPNLSGCIYSPTKSLQEDCEDAHVCVTFNSNSGVESVVEGIPVYAFDIGSMVYPIANKLWTDIENPKTPDRAQWFNDLAYCQWKPSEMKEGKAWRHLTR